METRQYRSMTVVRVLTGLLLALLLQSAWGEDEFIKAEDMPPDAVVATTARGIIESLNYEERSAIISGFTYDFGTIDMRVPIEVKMYKSDYGAFELLKPGMKVEIVYGDTGEVRLVVRLQQLANSTVLEDA